MLATSCSQDQKELSSEKPPNTEKIEVISDTISQIEEPNLPEVRLSKTDSLLLNPFDLAKFKKKKRGANSSGGGSQKYFYKPDIEGMYYGYFLFGGARKEGYVGKNKNNQVRLFNGIEINVFKPKDEDWTMYNDPNEILIEFMALLNDEDLPELAFVGWTKSELIEELGTPSFTKDQFLIYTFQQRCLILHMLGNKVDWLKYARLNLDLDANSEVPNLYKLDMFQF